MLAVDAAVLRTLLYADIFQFALTLNEIHLFLIHDQAVSCDLIEQRLKQSPLLRHYVSHEDGYYVLREHTAYIARRQEREALADSLWPVAQRYGAWMGQVPFVRMVALTGALSVRNPAHSHDDFDYLLVVQPGRVWLARAFAVIMVRLARRTGVHLCPNYVVAADELVEERQDLYTAHELVQMVPMYGKTIYDEMMARNSWLLSYMANAPAGRHAVPPDRPRWFKRLTEWLLSGRIGNWLERWEFRRKQRRFAVEAQRPGASAQIDAAHVKGHFDDHGSPVLDAYYQRLVDYQLTDLPAVANGD